MNVFNWLMGRRDGTVSELSTGAAKVTRVRCELASGMAFEGVVVNVNYRTQQVQVYVNANLRPWVNVTAIAAAEAAVIAA
jgi:hypothetical protein